MVEFVFVWQIKTMLQKQSADIFIRIHICWFLLAQLGQIVQIYCTNCKTYNKIIIFKRFYSLLITIQILNYLCLIKIFYS